jgi:hypothetical protein
MVYAYLEGKMADEKRHSRLGVASCVTFLIGVGLFFLMFVSSYRPIGERLPMPESILNEIVENTFSSVIVLLIIGTLLGILSLGEFNSKKQLGIIGLVANSLPLCLVVVGRLWISY